MQPMSHDAAATAARGTDVVANGAEGIAASTAAAASVTGLPPAGADEVSAQASTSFATGGTETLSQINAAQGELTQAGAALTKIAGMYSAIDDGASDTLD